MAFTTLPAAGAKLRASTLAALIGEVRPLRARLTSAFPLGTAGTLEIVTGLAVAVAANTTYDGILLIAGKLAAGTTEDLSVAMTYPTGSTLDVFTGELVTAATTFSGDFEMVYRASHASGSAIANAGLNATLATWTVMHITLATGANAGNLQVLAAQAVAGANVVTVQAGSKLILHQGV
jgi:hypothetical protein